MSLNPDNYGSLEPCRALAEAGVKVETEASWVVYASGNAKLIRTCDIGPRFLDSKEKFYPAPSMAEVWRELPEGILINGSWADLYLGKRDDSGKSYCGYNIEHHIIITFHSTNPTDALIHLRIWLKEKEK